MAKLTKIIRNQVEYELGGWNVIAMTQQEYNALSAAEKADGKLRIIKDAPAVDLWAVVQLASNSPIAAQTIWVWTQADYDALSTHDSYTIYYVV